MTDETFTDEELDQACEISDLVIDAIPEGTNRNLAATGCLMVVAMMATRYTKHPHLTVTEDEMVATFRKLCDVVRKVRERKKGK